MWDPAEQLITYLETLFEAGENVGYVTETWESDDNGKRKYLPTKGAWDRTAGGAYRPANSCGGDIGACLGDYNPEAGAWIRFNPLDGKGVKNENVTDYRYALVESDSMPMEQQNAIIRELELPVAALVYSGGKSLHAIVKIEAQNYDEYRKRVDYLYKVCKENGLDIDKQNRNPSRLSRMPGVIRNGRKQFILIELCISLAEGISWLGFGCAQGKVLYVNLELDRASCLHRFKDVYTTMQVKPDNLSKIDIWNLRGRSVPMDQLAPKLIRRAQKKNYIAIIIDPIYKVITGDENSADQMAHFCNQFDKVCTELGCAVIYCHHHSKGSQGGKRSMDRASGSGVFARDPDALLDLTELEITESLRKQQEDKAACSVIYEWLARFGFAQEISQDDRVTPSAMQQIAHDKLQSASYSLMMQDIDKAKAAVRARTAWRIEGTFREFPKLPPLNLWFDYPIHRADEDEVLKDAKYEGEDDPKKNLGRKKSKEQ